MSQERTEFVPGMAKSLRALDEIGTIDMEVGRLREISDKRESACPSRSTIISPSTLEAKVAPSTYRTREWLNCEDQSSV